ncbi:hypothetical protein ACE6H2_003844 [Prunus campanulata]
MVSEPDPNRKCASEDTGPQGGGLAFWELTRFGVMGTPKLSELGARAIPGWVTHWEVAREFPETKP